ncbi:MAG: LacI family DNA-binding transcriptional regulator [Candidatus Omnitrophica bacterium]|nr:LacI family DNA-binding transcriptional regulator [Candidatus Omnitrophota bacterium]MDD5574598.1 LacI family DNA-binding transcriptional regulator [Candidatus Omnitrophota bacterium]
MAQFKKNRGKMARKKAVGIEDVARAAGVSITTVSRVINKFPSVKEENRRKVEDVIRRLNFKPNLSAQRLASGSNYTIGLEIPRYEGIFYSFYAMEVFRSVGIACDALRVDFLLHLTDGKTSINAAAVGGVVFADIINNRQHVEDFQKAGTPVVLMNYLSSDMEISSVSVDNAGGAEAITEYLVHLGHSRIAFVTGDILTQAAQDRLEGYKTALKKAGLAVNEELVLRGDYSRKSARAAAEKLLELPLKATAVFASSDDMAMEMVSAFIEGGLKVPEDISVVGFDDDPVCLYGPVALTTVRQPIKEMAEAAVKELYLRMQDPDRQLNRIVLPAEIVIRDSACPPKKTVA